MHYTTNLCGVILHNVTKSIIWVNAIASVVSLSLLQAAKDSTSTSPTNMKFFIPFIASFMLVFMLALL
jgi:hypothetical protein